MLKMFWICISVFNTRLTWENYCMDMLPAHYHNYIFGGDGNDGNILLLQSWIHVFFVYIYIYISITLNASGG